MQQPMMLDNIRKLCQKEHPSFPACKTACAKARRRRGLRALQRHRVPFCVYSARPTPVSGAWAAQVGQVVVQVNDSKNAHESQRRLVELQKRLRGDFEDLVGPARKLVREASVQEVPTVAAVQGLPAESDREGPDPAASLARAVTPNHR